MTTVAIVVCIVVAAVLLTIVLRRRRSAHTSVDSFRRQIDALGPRARRTVVDQVQSAAERAAHDASEDGASGT